MSSDKLESLLVGAVSADFVLSLLGLEGDVDSSRSSAGGGRGVLKMGPVSDI